MFRGRGRSTWPSSRGTCRSRTRRSCPTSFRLRARDRVSSSPSRRADRSWKARRNISGPPGSGWTASSPIRSPSFFLPPKPPGRRGTGSTFGEGDSAPLVVFLIGETPAPLAGALPDAESIPLPEGISSAHLAAYGAALAPLRPDVGGGFSLRTSAEAALERERDRRWKLTAGIAAGVAVLLALGAFWFARWTEGEKAARTRALVKKEFAAVAPDVRNIVQPGVQIRAKLDSLRRQQKELGTDAPPPADMLQRASRALPKGEIAVREISIEGNRLRIAGDAGSDARLVETYRAGLADAFGPDFTATVQEAGGSVKGTSVKFTILVEKKGDRGAS
ncbi:MAG: hypothetical protein B7Z74_07370 [Deltaproteobacteria bacterium 21-66-5]|nr:MAG: hypothetical protein B7Z74_07370 [Deltaproteobacteria bacterium 21-66-5]